MVPYKIVAAPSGDAWVEVRRHELLCHRDAADLRGREAGREREREREKIIHVEHVTVLLLLLLLAVALVLQLGLPATAWAAQLTGSC
jgi:hypothetical protein